MVSPYIILAINLLSDHMCVKDFLGFSLIITTLRHFLFVLCKNFPIDSFCMNSYENQLFIVHVYMEGILIILTMSLIIFHTY